MSTLSEIFTYHSENNSFISMYGEVNQNAIFNTTGTLDVVEWGPVRDPLYIVVPVTVMYAIIFLTGVVGNVSTCIVIARNRSMHTATNYYLFSLAISDLLLLVSGLPPEMYYIWSKYPYIFGEIFCVLQGFAAETSANATVLTITAFTVERYVAICHPFMGHTMSNLSRAIKFVCAIWLIAMCLAIPQAMAFGLVYQTSLGDLDTWDLTRDDGVAVCVIKRQIVPHAFELSTFLFFVAPMTVITVLYVLIAAQLQTSRIINRTNDRSCKMEISQSKRPQTNSKDDFPMEEMKSGLDSSIGPPSCDHNTEVRNTNMDSARKNYPRKSQIRATRHVLKILVVVAFFICWAPFHAQRLLAIYAPADSTPSLFLVYNCLTYVSGVLYYLSTTINPLLYNIMSRKFRIAFKETLSVCLVRNQQRKVPSLIRRYSNLSVQQSNSNSHNLSQCYSNCNHSVYSSHRRYDPDFSKRPMVVTFRKIPKNLCSSEVNSQSDDMPSASRASNCSPLCELQLEVIKKADHDRNESRWRWTKKLVIFRRKEDAKSSEDQKADSKTKAIVSLKLNVWDSEKPYEADVCNTIENIVLNSGSNNNQNCNGVFKTDRYKRRQTVESADDSNIFDSELVPIHRCPKSFLCDDLAISNRSNYSHSYSLPQNLISNMPHSNTLPNIVCKSDNNEATCNFSTSLLDVLHSSDV